MEAFRFQRALPARAFIARIEEMPIHMHDGAELMYVLKGEPEVKISFNRYKLRAGDFLIVNAHEVHSLQAGKNTEILILQAGQSLFAGNEFAFDPHFYDQCNQEAVKEAKQAMVEAYLALKGEGPEPENIIRRLTSICDTFFQIHQYDVVHKEPMDFSSNETTESRIGNVYKLLYDHYDKKLRLSDVADMEHIDMFYTSRLLKGGMGIGFQDTLNIIRTDRAEVFLLGTDLPVQQVGEKVGFSSHTYFVKHFKERFGMTPSAYRQKYREEIYPKKKMNFRMADYGKEELDRLVLYLESGQKMPLKERRMEEVYYAAESLSGLCAELDELADEKYENEQFSLCRKEGQTEIRLKSRGICISLQPSTKSK